MAALLSNCCRLPARLQAFTPALATPARGLSRLHARPAIRTSTEDAPTSASTSDGPRSGPQLACLTSMLLLGIDTPVLAEEMVKYNAAGGEEFFKNAAGIGYVLLVGVFLSRVLRRRAARAKEQKISSAPPDGGPSLFDKLRQSIAPVSPERQQQATAFDALLGAAQAGLLGAGLFLFASKMTAIMSAQALPDGYTARNISITVRTILQGLVWLATFIFCVNSVGLLGLSVQLLIFPDSLKEEEEKARARRAASGAPQLPKVSLTSSPEDVRRAFDAAERLGKASASKTTSGEGGQQQQQ